MEYAFKSGFKDKLNEFVCQKKALGLSYDSNMRYLSGFDKMCGERYPMVTSLTDDICHDWATKKPTENANAFRNRISPIRELAKFLIRNGEEAHIIPTNLIKKAARHLPYIYSKEEITAIWKEYDSITPISYFPTRHIVLPAIMRILYCCGLRPCEACKLQPCDVDLAEGKLYIRESKGHKDRIVMMSSDVSEYIRKYNQRVSAISPKRKWFFPNANGNACTDSWLSAIFLKIRRKLVITGMNGVEARLYDIRHTFATHRLYEWMREGKDLRASLPYLSTYMGHAQLTDTYYYIHLVPEQFAVMSGLDFSHFEALLPEVTEYERLF